MHMMTAWLLLKTFLTKEIQVLKHRWKESVNCKRGYVEKTPHLVTFYESILVSR